LGTKYFRILFGDSSLYRKQSSFADHAHPAITTLPTITPVGSFPRSLLAIRQSLELSMGFFEAYK
jgi:hypothetical protein